MSTISRAAEVATIDPVWDAVTSGARQVAQSGFGTGGRRSQSVEKVLGPVKRWLQDFF